MIQAISLSYVGSPTDNSPQLPWTAEEHPRLTQRGTRGQPANAGKADQEAEAGRPTVVAAEFHPETVQIPRDSTTVPRNVCHLPYRYQQDSFNISFNHLYFSSITTSLPKEGSLITDTATDRHNTYFTTLQLYMY